MATIRIALQDGFEDETVVISVNGKEVFNQKNVKTKRQIGKAASFDVEVEAGSSTVEISLPSKSLSESITLKVSGKAYLGVSVVNNRIVHRISSEPFHYA